MTLRELNTYFDLLQQLQKTEDLLNNLMCAIEPASPTLTGMPKSTSDTYDKIGNLAIEIIDAEKEKAYYEAEIEKQRAKTESFIQSIGDVWTRTLFRLRFLRGLTWKEVAQVMGGNNTEDGVKSACYRYLQRGDAP